MQNESFFFQDVKSSIENLKKNPYAINKEFMLSNNIEGLLSFTVSSSNLLMEKDSVQWWNEIHSTRKLFLAKYTSS